MSATALSCSDIQVPELSNVINKVMRGREKLERIWKSLIGKKTDSFCAELAEAKTCVRTVMSDLQQIQHEAEVVISIATFKGEDGKRPPLLVDEAKKKMFASFHTEEQTEYKRYLRIVATRYGRVQKLLDEFNKRSSMTRAENALCALGKKTTPISGWQKWLHRIGIVVTAAAAAGCVVAIGTGATLGAGTGLACGAGALVFVSILTAYRYDRVTDASAEKYHKAAGEVQETLADAKYNIVEIEGGLKLHLSLFEEFGSTALQGTDEIERIYTSRLGPLEDDEEECRKALRLLKKNTQILKEWDEKEASKRYQGRSLPPPTST